LFFGLEQCAKHGPIEGRKRKHEPHAWCGRTLARFALAEQSIVFDLQLFERLEDTRADGAVIFSHLRAHFDLAFPMENSRNDQCAVTFFEPI
jgi:hypothetical protein